MTGSIAAGWRGAAASRAALCVLVIILGVLLACAPAAPAGAPAGPPAASGTSAAPTGQPAAARPSTVAALSAYQSADRQQLLEDGARREGTLTWYTSLAGPIIERLFGDF